MLQMVLYDSVYLQVKQVYNSNIKSASLWCKIKVKSWKIPKTAKFISLISTIIWFFSLYTSNAVVGRRIDAQFYEEIDMVIENRSMISFMTLTEIFSILSSFDKNYLLNMNMDSMIYSSQDFKTVEALFVQSRCSCYKTVIYKMQCYF